MYNSSLLTRKIYFSDSTSTDKTKSLVQLNLLVMTKLLQILKAQLFYSFKGQEENLIQAFTMTVRISVVQSACSNRSYSGEILE